MQQDKYHHVIVTARTPDLTTETHRFSNTRSGVLAGVADDGLLEVAYYDTDGHEVHEVFPHGAWTWLKMITEKPT